MSLISPVADRDGILKVKNACENIFISDKVSEYIVTLVNATRNRPEFALGASPRASLSLMRLARAVAMMSKREYVLPKDVAEIYVDVLSHRVVLSREAKIGGVGVKKVLTDILSSTKVPFIENEK